MKRFLKKHFLFVAVIGISVMAVLVLMVMAIIQTGDLDKSKKRLEDRKSIIKRLNSESPSPNLENKELILADKEKYDKRLDALHRYFGRPYERALKRFCEELNVPVDEFRDMFRKAWEDGISKNHTGDEIYRRFVADGGIAADAEPVYEENADGERVEVPAKRLWTRETWDKAMTAFVEEARKYTVEDVTVGESNAPKELLMLSLGVPRTFGNDPEECRRYVEKIKAELAKRFETNNVGLGAGARDFSFNITGNPSRAMIIPIGKVWDIIGDLANRISECNEKSGGIRSLEYFSVDSIEGMDGDSGFHLYRFQIEVSGTLDGIRKLTRDLAAAFADSRVYIVRRVALMKDFDEAQVLIDEHGKPKTDDAAAAATGMVAAPVYSAAPTANMLDSSIRTRLGNIEDFSRNNPAGYMRAKAFIFDELLKVPDSEENTPPYLRMNYGRPIIGVGKSCTATIVVDYVVYVTDELATKTE
ncbi:MAG: hypothetical protein AB7F40_00685 [Victivallaceae bacterium]|nr:hypothetical protein [Victivallaceae bacterium]